MPFDTADPRATLITQPAALPREFGDPQLIPFTDNTADVSALGTRQWLVRIQHAVIAYAYAVSGEVWPGPLNGETLLVMPEGDASVSIISEAPACTVGSGAVAVIPEGRSEIKVIAPGTIIRVFPAAHSDLLESCINAQAYVQPAVNVAPYVPPDSDHDLRTYRLGDYPPDPGRFGHIFRSTNLMINFIATRKGPRDPTKLSPHSHADFEQCSLQLSGRFVHHVRTPWTPSMNNWRPDRHLELSGAGAVIFPPPLEHTSQAVGSELNRLIDVFAPPRQDFLEKPGWVLNASDYESSK